MRSIVTIGGRKGDLARLRLSFDRRQFGRLRLLIDRINASVTDQRAQISSTHEPL